MTCDQTQPLLDAFAGHELGWGTSWRIRRHLAACPACMAELAETQQLAARVRAWRDVSAPATLQSHIAAALASAPPISASHRPVTVRRAAVGLAGVAATAAAFFWLTPGQPGRPTIAFADVEQAMQRVQTVSWEARTDLRPDADMGTSEVRVSVINWLRRNPPAIASTGADVTPSHNPDRMKTLSDARGQFFLTKEQCNIRLVHNGFMRQMVENQIRSFTQFPQPAPSSDFGGRVHTMTTNFRQSSVALDGQNRIRFDRTVKTVYSSEGRTDYQTAYVSTWVDLETHRVVRNESHISENTFAGNSFRPYVIVEDHFRYDQTPPKGTFDWSAPAGVRVVKMQPGPTKR